MVGIRHIFGMSWEKAVMATAMDSEADIYPEQRVIIRQTNIGKLALGEICIVYGEGEDYPTTVIARFPHDALLFAAWVHIKEQEKRLLAAGIHAHVQRLDGLLQCVYDRVPPQS